MSIQETLEGLIDLGSHQLRLFLKDAGIAETPPFYSVDKVEKLFLTGDRQG